MSKKAIRNAVKKFRELGYNHINGTIPSGRNFESKVRVSDSIFDGSSKRNGKWVSITLRGETIEFGYYPEGYVGPPDETEKLPAEDVDAELIVEKVESFTEDRYSVFKN